MCKLLSTFCQIGCQINANIFTFIRFFGIVLQLVVFFSFKMLFFFIIFQNILLICHYWIHKHSFCFIIMAVILGHNFTRERQKRRLMSSIQKQSQEVKVKVAFKNREPSQGGDRVRWSGQVDIGEKRSDKRKTTVKWKMHTIHLILQLDQNKKRKKKNKTSDQLECICSPRTRDRKSVV